MRCRLLCLLFPCSLPGSEGTEIGSHGNVPLVPFSLYYLLVLGLGGDFIPASPLPLILSYSSLPPISLFLRRLLILFPPFSPPLPYPSVPIYISFLPYYPSFFSLPRPSLHHFSPLPFPPGSHLFPFILNPLYP
jgi:hypothetical protein